MTAEKSLRCKVLDARPRNRAAGEDAVAIAVLRLLNAVGGHQNGAGELGKLFRLILPCATVVSSQMLVSLELGIAVRGQHFTVSVNLDAGVLGLLQQRGEIGKIVAADQDGLTGNRMDANRGGRGIPESVRVDLVQTVPSRAGSARQP